MIANNYEAVKEILYKNEQLILSTCLSNLTSLTNLEYKSTNDDLNDYSIVVQVQKNSITYHQLLFNANCSIAVNNQVNIIGTATIVPRESDESTATVKILFQKIFYLNNQINFSNGRKESSFLSTLKKNSVIEFQYWFRISRAPFFTATIIPIMLGIILAWIIQGEILLFSAILTIIGGIFLHAGTNLINDYFDQRTDNLNTNFTPFNGGSRTIQLQLASQEKILYSAIISFVIGSILILVMMITINSVELYALFALGLFLAIFYTAGPLKLSHHGFGEISNFLGYGPILTLSSWLIQVKGIYLTEDALLVLYWSFIPGLLLVLILLINEFQDYESDKKAGKKTLIVRLGKSKGFYMYTIISVMTYVIILLGVFIYNQYAMFGIIALLGILLSIRAYSITKVNFNKIEELIPANALTVQNHMITNLLLMIGLIATKLIFV
jgi:1,4-dihydroxy-2-naphthoate octaprenyltransferase